jgi:D-beta-D-heptose 7-phosphate kinase/D-beta-D-heptose 1-phosphate adenosyltransferase
MYSKIFDKVRTLVIGDVMLDQYWHGGTSRISPEAPVPVVHINRMDERPGGAANVAIGVSALGAMPYLFGLTGSDAAADTLERLLCQEKVKYQLSRVPDYNTITKLRVLSRNHQMIRLDREKAFVKDSPTMEQLVNNFANALAEVDIVILSDYAKGTLAHSAKLIAMARAHKVPVVVDPKSLDFSMYQGATVITPNLKEFEAVVGACPTLDILVEKALSLLAKYEIDSIVITRSEQGLSVISANGEVMHIPALAREVHDVTGAGDTVIAVLGVALAAGMSLVEAASLGNIAAGIVVGKLGAATVSVAELELAFSKDEVIPIGVMTEAELLLAVCASKANGERIVFTNGCFDLLHAGHVLYLQQARALGDRVIVAVNDDDSVSKLKGPSRPINCLDDRMQVLAGLRSVDWVVSFSEDTPERLIERISPHVLVKGGDYHDIEALPGASFVLSQGAEVRILGLKEGRSTTQLIATMKDELLDVTG